MEKFNNLHVQFHHRLNRLNGYYTELLLNDYQYQYKLATKKRERRQEDIPLPL